MRTVLGPLAEKFSALLHLGDPPHRLALALAVGVFIGCTPFWGLQTILCVAVATVCRLNRAAAVTGAWIILPWFAPFVYGAALELGVLVVPGSRETSAGLVDQLVRGRGSLSWTTLWSWLRSSSLPLLVGSTIVGAATSALAYVIAYVVLARRRGVRRDEPRQTPRRRVA